VALKLRKLFLLSISLLPGRELKDFSHIQCLLGQHNIEPRATRCLRAPNGVGLAQSLYRLEIPTHANVCQMDQHLSRC